jgi:hypothetical protein
VLVKAAHDDALEGERKVMISHSLLIVGSKRTKDGVRRHRDPERRGAGAG